MTGHDTRVFPGAQSVYLRLDTPTHGGSLRPLSPVTARGEGTRSGLTVPGSVVHSSSVAPPPRRTRAPEGPPRSYGPVDPFSSACVSGSVGSRFFPPFPLLPCVDPQRPTPWSPSGRPLTPVSRTINLDCRSFSFLVACPDPSSHPRYGRGDCVCPLIPVGPRWIRSPATTVCVLRTGRPHHRPPDPSREGFDRCKCIVFQF